MARSALEFEQETSAGATLPATVSAVLTIIAVEEPENHLAPQYLGRILASLRGILDTDRAQILLTSQGVPDAHHRHRH